MPYLHCPTCGLTLARHGAVAWIDRCPRCLARQRASIVMLDWSGPRRAVGSADAEQQPVTPALSGGTRFRREDAHATR